MQESANDTSITNLFTIVAHHRNCFITQNMYHQSLQNKTRNLNVHYLVFFKNVRDTTVIQTLARQMNNKMLIEVFKDITKIP